MMLNTISNVLVLALLASGSQAYAGIILPNLAEGTQYRLVFLTSDARIGVSNIGDANTFVSQQANLNPELVVLGTTWRAVASKSGVDAIDNTSTSGPGGFPIYRLDGVKIADDYPDLWDGTIEATISLDQFGVAHLSEPYTYTNSSGHSFGNSGNTRFTDERWIALLQAGNKTNPRSFYGMSGVLVAVPEPSNLWLCSIAGMFLIGVATRGRKHHAKQIEC